MTRSEAEQRLLVEKWSLLCEMEMVGDKGVFIFGKSGSLTDTEMYTTLKVTMTETILRAQLYTTAFSIRTTQFTLLFASP